MLGLKYWNIHDFLPEDESIARNKYQLGAGLKVLNVASESPAEKAGFKVGFDSIDKKLIHFFHK